MRSAAIRGVSPSRALTDCSIVNTLDRSGTQSIPLCNPGQGPAHPVCDDLRISRPNARRRWVWITPGAAVATALWILASLGFRWYASHFGDYQRTYGAIGGVIVALLWLYVQGLAIITGAELNGAVEQAAAERQAPRKALTSAVGDPRPRRVRRSVSSAPP
ncbi:MAG: YihY/virulence factor BrkB family protein [Bacteroidales bacterium]